MKTQEEYLTDKWTEHPEIPGVYLKRLSGFVDKRGFLMELERCDECDAIQQHEMVMSYYSETTSGESRGPHEHEQQTDLFFFIRGIGSVHLWDNRKPIPEGATPKRVVIQKYADVAFGLLIPPGVVHGYKCQTGALHALAVINMPDRLYKGKNKEGEVDEIRHEDDPNSPFKF